MKGTEATSPKRLLILCCEYVYDKGRIYAEFPEDKEVYKKQLLASVGALKRGDFDILIISGGYTRKEIKKSEAQGMLDWTKDLGLNLENFLAHKRIILEEYARDSFENLLFSICRFYQVFKIFPKEICIISWKFKENRIRTIAKALKIPNFKYLAVGEKNASDLESTLFQDDLLCQGKFFSQKRQKRNPWKRRHPYSKVKREFLANLKK